MDARPIQARFEPWDISLEQALLGSFLLDNRTISIAAERLKASDFYDPFHQAIADLIFDLDDQKKSVSPLTLNTWLKHAPGAADVGGALSYLATLAGAAPAKPPVNEYATVLIGLRERRDAEAALGDAADGLSARQPVLEALSSVVEVADTISSSQMSTGIDTRAVSRGHETLRQIEEQAKIGEIFGCRTGLDPLDELIGGLYPENLIIAGGRPGMGKSILACNLLLTAARQGYATDYWSIEMPSREVMARILCDIDYDLALRERLTPLHYQDLVKMRATGEQIQRAALANRELQDLEIDIFDRDRVTIDDIASVSRARAARAPGKKRLVVIDHMHIIMPSERYRGRRVDELSEITGSAKRLAKRIEAPVLMLAQLSRDIEKRDDKRPFMSDFRDSGSIEQDADVVMSVYRGQYYAEAAIRQAKNEDQRGKAIMEYDRTKNEMEVGVHKQRSGKTETAKVFVDVKSSVVRSADPGTGTVPELTF